MKITLPRALIAASALLIGIVQAGTVSFVNTNSITIRDGNSASLYPSSITVSGLNGTFTTVTVSLKSLSHANMADVDMLLVGPTDAKLVLFSDAGGNNFLNPGNLLLDDAGGSLLPSSLFSAGSYKPTDYGNVADTFLSPAPLVAFSGDSATPTGTSTLAQKFSGTNPNGVWSLYIMDDTTNGLSGSMAGGWALNLTTVGGLPPTILTNAVINASGQFQFGFSGTAATTNYSVLRSTNLVTWSVLGTATEISSGKFRFIDVQPRTNSARFYRVQSP